MIQPQNMHLGSPYTICSQMDRTKALTRDLWAVTLIIPQSTNPTHHAQIFVEGNTERYFAYVIHLTGVKLSANGYDCAENCHNFYSDKGRVIVKKLGPNQEWRVKIKSDTFMRAASKVQKLIDEAKTEELQYENKEFTNPTPFNHLGSRSQLIGNNVNYQITDPRLRELYDNNQRNFHFVRRVAQDPKENNRVFWTYVALAVLTMPMFCLPAFGYYYLKTGVFLPFQTQKFTVLADSDSCIENNPAIESARTNIMERLVRPNSCMTWTRDKLLLVDIVVTDIFWDNIISVTDEHIKKLQNVS
jgi:hypothetical protein